MNSVLIPKDSSMDEDARKGQAVMAKLRPGRSRQPNLFNEADEFDFNNGMVRAQSLRDLTSKFEKLGSNNTASNTKGYFTEFLFKKFCRVCSLLLYLFPFSSYAPIYLGSVFYRIGANIFIILLV